MSTEPKIRQKGSIMPDLEGLDYDESIKLQACEVFSELSINMPKRKNNGQPTKTLKGILLWCLYVAHEILNKDISLCILAYDLKMKKTEVCKAITTYCNDSQRVKNYGMRDPKILIRDVAKRLKFTEERQEEMLILWEKLVNKDPSLTEINNNAIISSFMWYYCYTHSSDYSIQDIASLFMLNEQHVKKYYNKIVTVISQS